MQHVMSAAHLGNKGVQLPQVGPQVRHLLCMALPFSVQPRLRTGIWQKGRHKVVAGPNRQVPRLQTPLMLLSLLVGQVRTYSA